MQELYKKLANLIRITNLKEDNFRKAESADFKKMAPTTDRFRLYVHFPFCSKLCKDCLFSKRLVDEGVANNYCEALLKEIEYVGEHYKKSKSKIPSVFFGGGTPTLIPLDYLKKIIDKIKFYFIEEDTSEITLECHPGSLTPEKVEAYKAMGINRLSVGIQSFQDEVLDEMKRNHNSQQAVDTLKYVKKSGMNFSIDLMYGFDTQTVEGFLNDVQMALDLGITHISLYNYVKKLDNIQAEEELETKQTNMFNGVTKLLTNAGFTQYTIDDFALTEAKKGQYNVDQVAIPRRHTLVFGTSAKGFTDGNIYYSKYVSIETYIKCIEKKIPPLYFIENRDNASTAMGILMGLHSLTLNRSDLKKEFGIDPIEIPQSLITELKNRNVMEVTDSVVKYTEGKVQAFKTLSMKIQCHDIKPPKDPENI